MAKSDPTVDMLARVPLFSGLNRKELAQVHGLSKVFQFEPGETVVAEGEAASRFFLVTEGTAQVVSKGRVLRMVDEGDWFGELALIDEGPRSATVVALTPLTTLAIAGFNFRPMLKSEASISYKLLVEVAGWLRDAQAARLV
jgi:CRP-like cAMP-binding protein